MYIFFFTLTFTTQGGPGGDYFVTKSLNRAYVHTYMRTFPVAGELFTKAMLDREVSAQYVVPVVARDGGGRTGYTLVRVNVGDKGDHSPQFQLDQYKANVYADAPLHMSILQVRLRPS